MIYPALWINHNFSQMFPIANFVYKANARFVLTIARSRSRNISRYFPRTIGDVLQRMLAPPRRDFEQKRSSRNLASLWISTDASLSATPPHPPTPPACSFSLFLSLPSYLSRKVRGCRFASQLTQIRADDKPESFFVCVSNRGWVRCLWLAINEIGRIPPPPTRSIRRSWSLLSFFAPPPLPRAFLFCASRSPDEW